MVFNSQIVLTKNGYSADPTSKTLSDPGENADEDAATLQASWYDMIRSRHHCVEGLQALTSRDGTLYMQYKCKTHSTLCSGPRYLNQECASEYEYIPALKKAVVSGCRCKAD